MQCFEQRVQQCFEQRVQVTQAQKCVIREHILSLVCF